MPERPVLDQVNIVTADMDGSLAFYRRLGMVIPDRDPEWDPHHRSATTGSGMSLDLDSLAYAREWDQGWRGEGPGGGCVLTFKVVARTEVDRIYADLTGAGYRGHQEPYDAPWGARFAVVEDPDGNAVGLMSAIDAAQRSASSTPPA